jgi:hypothetical protein
MVCVWGGGVSGTLMVRLCTVATRLRIGGNLLCFYVPFLPPDAYLDPRFDRAMDLKTGFVTRSLVAVPILDHAGAIVGVLQVHPS